MNAWVFPSDDSCFALLKKSSRFQMLTPMVVVGIMGLSGPRTGVKL
jgi:hypothetical protein